MRSHFLPSKTVKTSWIRRNPVGAVETAPSPEKYFACGKMRWLFTVFKSPKCRCWDAHSHLKRQQSCFGDMVNRQSPQSYLMCIINTHFNRWRVDGAGAPDRDIPNKTDKQLSTGTPMSINSTFNLIPSFDLTLLVLI